jgi:DNA-binding response OmpR family regulator
MTVPWQGKRALVVEDEAMVSMMLEDALTEMGCVIAGSAARLAEAQALAASLAIDFAILDLNLNGELSYPVAEVLAGRGIPFIFSTGYGPKALPAHLRDVLTIGKPFEFRELERAVAAALASRPGG